MQEMQKMQETFTKIKKLIDAAKSICVFYDDDLDGLSSYLSVYWYKKVKGICVKSSPKVQADFSQVVKRHNADLVVILDKPLIEETFFDPEKTYIWIDHHDCANPPENVIYVNPKKMHQPNHCTVYWVRQILQTPLWISALGSISDWDMNPDVQQFCTQYPQLCNKQTIDELLFDAKISALIQKMSFALKGQTDICKTHIKIFEKHPSFDSYIHPTSEDMHSVFATVQIFIDEYKKQINAIKGTRRKEIIHVYETTTTSFTTELANELYHKYPKKLIIVARKTPHQHKCSIRYYKPIKHAVLTAISGLDGYGGGHDNACGACVSNEQFDEFVHKVKEQLS
jgi:single-stranded DNA-specific DHH superfamily exonuclease